MDACECETRRAGCAQEQIRLLGRRKGTTTAELERLSAWLGEYAVTHVAMEATGVYWKPVYNVLSEAYEIWVVNAQHLKQVPGRKTDVKDAEWIAQLMQMGLLEQSFIPDVEQRDLRDLTRYRKRLIEDKSTEANRLHKILEDANIKLTSVLSDIQGVSARLMLEALIENEQDAPQIAELAKGTLRKKIPKLVEALSGQVRGHHRTARCDSWRQPAYRRVHSGRGQHNGRQLPDRQAFSFLGLHLPWQSLSDPDAEFQELGGDYFHKRDAEQIQRQAVRKLESLGLHVTLEPVAA